MAVFRQEMFLFTAFFYKLLAVPLGNFADDYGYLENKNDPVCVTPGCMKAAALALKNLDTSVDPCNDFYDFACGGFIQNNPIPRDKSSISSLSVIADRLKEQLRQVFAEPVSDKDIKPFALVKRLYQTCMNERKIENDGLEPLKRILDKLGGWPVLDSSWDEADFDWNELMYRSRKLGLETNRYIDIFVQTDILNTSQRTIDIAQANLGLEREYLVEGLQNRVVKAYYDYLVDVAVIFGADKQTAQRDMLEAVNFEINLAKITLPKEELRNATLLTNPMTIGELQKRFPFMNWQEYLNKIANVEEVVVCLQDMVDVGIPLYLTDLGELLGLTSKRVQANYLFSRAVISLALYLTKEIRDREQEYNTVLVGIPEMEPRWKQCTDLAAIQLHLASDALYVRRFFGEEAKSKVEELVSTLKNTFISMLKQVNWMDESTRKVALDKALAIQAHVAYPKELMEDFELEKFYKNLNPETANFLKFNLQLNKFHKDTEWKKLPKVVDKTDWRDHSSATDVNAYYIFLENSIQLSAGILQGVLFDNDRPNYMNFGSIGFAIGHEITHGFDDQGRQYYKDGTLKNWWAEKTNSAFTEKAQCIIEQYGNITEPDVMQPLNGINTQGENIADNGGAKEAYLAYNSWIKKHGEEPLLPGLNYSQRQLFWISTANLWCANERTEYNRQKILTDSHAPNKYRVNVPLSNFDGFAKDFNCPSGSNMNPIEKCHVW